MTPVVVLLLLTAPLITLGYIGVCLATPFGPCRHCARSTQRRRRCHRCNATGLRPRLGWRLFTYLRRLHRDSTH